MEAETTDPPLKKRERRPGIACPACGAARSSVRRTEATTDAYQHPALKRRRLCAACGVAFATLETLPPPAPNPSPDEVRRGDATNRRDREREFYKRFPPPFPQLADLWRALVLVAADASAPDKAGVLADEPETDAGEYDGLSASALLDILKGHQQ